MSLCWKMRPTVKPTLLHLKFSKVQQTKNDKRVFSTDCRKWRISAKKTTKQSCAGLLPLAVQYAAATRYVRQIKTPRGNRVYFGFPLSAKLPQLRRTFAAGGRVSSAGGGPLASLKTWKICLSVAEPGAIVILIVRLSSVHMFWNIP